MRTKTPAFEAGLTLIELLVAVALLAIITAMAYRGLESMTGSSQSTLAEGERWQTVGMFFERFSNDVTRPAHRPIRAGDPTAAPLPEWWGRPADNDPAAAQLEFTRKSPPGRDEVRLGYRLRENRVELLVWPVLDRAPASVPEVHVLLEGVASLRFQYLDNAGKWQDVWPIPGNLVEPQPRAVAVDMSLSGGIMLHRVFALPS